MKRPSRDEEREQRITMEIVVDAYTPEEQAMGWYYSLEDRLHFPFMARCITERACGCQIFRSPHATCAYS